MALELVARGNSMSSTPPEKPLLELLKYHLAAGEARLTRTLPRGEFSAWVATIRHFLFRIYGTNSPHVDALFPKCDYTKIDAGDVHKLLNERLTVLRSYIARLEVVGSQSGQVGNRVFIGHGRSLQWTHLRHFLMTRLGLSVDEFNQDVAAGLSTAERLEQMLSSAGFALLVMTAEDQGLDAKMHARPNVIHEIGLFQGRLGFDRAIILLEQGCEEFSNIHGLTQLRFPAGDIGARFEDVRRVLEFRSRLT